MTDIICNATSLIAFARIGQLSLMQNVVEQLAIPNAVVGEVTNYKGSAARQISLFGAVFVFLGFDLTPKGAVAIESGKAQ